MKKIKLLIFFLFISINIFVIKSCNTNSQTSNAVTSETNAYKNKYVTSKTLYCNKYIIFVKDFEQRCVVNGMRKKICCNRNDITNKYKKKLLQNTTFTNQFNSTKQNILLNQRINSCREAKIKKLKDQSNLDFFLISNITKNSAYYNFDDLLHNKHLMQFDEDNKTYLYQIIKGYYKMGCNDFTYERVFKIPNINCKNFSLEHNHTDLNKSNFIINKKKIFDCLLTFDDIALKTYFHKTFYYGSSNIITIDNFDIILYLITNKETSLLKSNFFDKKNYNIINTKAVLHKYQELFSNKKHFKNSSLEWLIYVKSLYNETLNQNKNNENKNNCLSELHLRLPSIIDVVVSSYYKAYKRYLYLCGKKYYESIVGLCEITAECEATNFALNSILNFSDWPTQREKNNFTEIFDYCSLDNFENKIREKNDSKVFNDNFDSLFSITNDEDQFLNLNILVYITKSHESNFKTNFSIWQILSEFKKVSNNYVTDYLNHSGVNFYFLKTKECY